MFTVIFCIYIVLAIVSRVPIFGVKAALVLLIFSGILVSPGKAFAQSGTTLLVWVDDKDADGPMRPAFTEEAYTLTLSRLNSSGLTNIKTVYLKQTKKKQPVEVVEKKVFSSVAQALDGVQSISNIIIATHGGTSGSQTKLTYLGEFGSKGVSGILKGIIRQIGPFLSPDLHVYLDSCSTFCGTEGEVLERGKGFASEFQNFGVRNVSIWGARQMLAGAVGEKVEFRESIYKLNQFAISRSVLAGIGMVAVSFTMLSDLTFNTSFLPQSFMIGGGLVAAILTSVNGFAYYLHKATGTSGYLLDVNSDGTTKLRDAERWSPEAIFGRQSCGEILESLQNGLKSAQ